MLNLHKHQKDVNIIHHFFSLWGLKHIDSREKMKGQSIRGSKSSRDYPCEHIHFCETIQFVFKGLGSNIFLAKSAAF
jgi:hypothetical protein